MRSTRARIAAAVAVSLVAGVVLPGTGASQATLPPMTEADLIQPGRLAICSSFPRIRFAEVDAAGTPFGADVDIGLEIASRLGLQADVQEVPFEGLIDAVVQRQCDVSISGQFITQARLAIIDMIPYREGTPHVIVGAGNPLGIDELPDLCGRSMAVVSGTLHAEIVRGTGDYEGRGLDDGCRSSERPSVDLREYPSQDEAEDALARGEVDAYSGNDFIVVERPEDFALSAALPPTRNGIGHRKDAPSLAAGLRASLDGMIADGTYRAILERYGVAHVAVSSPP